MANANMAGISTRLPGVLTSYHELTVVNKKLEWNERWRKVIDSDQIAGDSTQPLVVINFLTNAERITSGKSGLDYDITCFTSSRIIDCVFHERRGGGGEQFGWINAS